MPLPIIAYILGAVASTATYMYAGAAIDRKAYKKGLDDGVAQVVRPIERLESKLDRLLPYLAEQPEA